MDSYAGRGVNGSDVYMVGFCDATETADDALTSTSTVITSAVNQKLSAPKPLYVTNTTYGYYSMKNGSAFNKAFTDTDWCKLTFTGVTTAW